MALGGFVFKEGGGGDRLSTSPPTFTPIISLAQGYLVVSAVAMTCRICSIVSLGMVTSLLVPLLIVTPPEGAVIVPFGTGDFAAAKGGDIAPFMSGFLATGKGGLLFIDLPLDGGMVLRPMGGLLVGCVVPLLLLVIVMLTLVGRFHGGGLDVFGVPSVICKDGILAVPIGWFTTPALPLLLRAQGGAAAPVPTFGADGLSDDACVLLHDVLVDGGMVSADPGLDVVVVLLFVAATGTTL